jgi:uncharacterized protein DUF4349
MPRINHPIEQEELMAYLDGELPVDRASGAAAHLERCWDCQGLAAHLQSVSRRLMEWQIESVPLGITPDLIGALAAPSATVRARKLWSSRWIVAPACGIVVALFLLWSPSRRLASRKYEMQELAQQNSTLATRALATPPARAPGIALFLNAPEPMIARTAQLSLTTEEFDKSRAALEEILKRHNGYFGQLNVNAPAGSGRTLDATLHIPADQRDAAITEIKKLGRVESESQTGEEVTSQYVDLEARLSNARHTEQRLTDMLRQRTGKLSDVLAVEQEISRVRGEIEQMEAQKKTLTARVEFLTLDVKLTEDYRAQLQVAPDSILGRFRNAAIAGYKSVIDGAVNLVLFLLAYGPMLLIWAALLFFPARLAWKRFRRN